MLELFHHCFSDEAPDIAGYYKGAGSGLRRHIKNRTADPDMKILDISFRELVTDVEGPIRAFYEFCGMALSDTSLQRMFQWNERNPKDAKGKHVYSLEQYGFTKEQIEQDFAGYLEFMKSRVGGS